MRIVWVGLAGLVVILLTGCSTVEPVSSATPTAEPAAPTASGPLACDDLVPVDLVAEALTGADGAAVAPESAVQPGRAFDNALLAGAGGLGCSWRVGDAPASYYGSSADWAYLAIAVLPGAAAQWVPLWAGDSPSTESAMIDGIEASTAATEGGWRISAPVGESWIQLSIAAGGLTSTGSRFDGLPDGTVSSRLAEAAAAVFDAVAGARPEQLDWPRSELRQADAVCNGALDEGGITAVMQLPVGAVVEYVAVDPTSTAPTHFDEAVRSAARTFDCELRVNGVLFTTITSAWGLGSGLDLITGSDAAPFFNEVEFPGGPAAVEAVVASHHDGPSSPAYLVVDGALYEIQGDGTVAIAEAIVAQTS